MLAPSLLSSLHSNIHFTILFIHDYAHRTLAKYSPTPSTAQLLLSTVQKMWKRMERDPSSVSRDEVPFSCNISAVAAFACRPGQYDDEVIEVKGGETGW